MWRISAWLIMILKGGFFNLSLNYLPEFIYEHKQRYLKFHSLKKNFIKGTLKNNAGDLSRLSFIMINLERIKNLNEKYCFAEIGCYKGNTSSVISNYIPKEATFYICDTFSGFDENSLNQKDQTSYQVISKAFKNTSKKVVEEKLSNKNQCELIEGYFPKSASKEMINSIFSFVLIDCDLYEPIINSLEFFKNKMTKGGLIMVHDYNSRYYQGATEAVDIFCKKYDKVPILMADKSGTVCITF